MRCPTCNTENTAAAVACACCKGALPAPAVEVPAPDASAAPVGAGEAEAKPRRSRRRRNDPQGDAAVSPLAEEHNRQVRRAYALCLLGLVPFLGLVLGPLSAFLASRIRRLARDEPGFTAQIHARATVILGTLTGITNWVGLALMVIGLLTW